MQFASNKMHIFYAYTLISFDNSLEKEMATHSSIMLSGKFAWKIMPFPSEPKQGKKTYQHLIHSLLI